MGTPANELEECQVHLVIHRGKIGQELCEVSKIWRVELPSQYGAEVSWISRQTVFQPTITHGS